VENIDSAPWLPAGNPHRESTFRTLLPCMEIILKFRKIPMALFKQNLISSNL